MQQQICDQPSAKHQVRGQSARKGPLCLLWCGRGPCEMKRPSSVVDGNMAYFKHYQSKNVHSYNSEKKMWSILPQCSDRYCSLAVVNGLLTAIGGRDRNNTNQLLSLTVQRKWVEHFPPMPTKHYATAAVCSGKSLVVAGDNKDLYPLNTVEVMDTETLQWSTASSLPFALVFASATIFQDHIYLLGHYTTNILRSVLACSMTDLLQSCRSQSLSKVDEDIGSASSVARVADLPVCKSRL